MPTARCWWCARGKDNYSKNNMSPATPVIITSRASTPTPADRTSPPWRKHLSTTDTRYGRAALRSELDRLRACEPGGRHDALNTGAFRLAQLTVATVRRALVDAGIQHGFREREVERIVASAIAAGLRSPRGL